MNNLFVKRFLTIIVVMLFLSLVFSNFSFESVCAGNYNGEDLASAILADQSTLISSSYEDNDQQSNRQGTVLSSIGNIHPTHGSTFTLLSTGIAGDVPVTINGENPGDERGTWFRNEYGYPRDEVTLSMQLQVPNFYHYLYYDIQFFSAEYPEYIGTKFNDKLTVTVDSPSQGISEYVFDVNSGYFVHDSHDIQGTGFDIFAQSGDPNDVDWVDTTPSNPGADGGASDLIQIGGLVHPISPNEIITVTFNLIDSGDNLFDSAALIDNLFFTGYAETYIIARKNVEDLNGGDLESNDTVEYTISITNSGNAPQTDNTGNEFEDEIPENTTFIIGSETATDGSIGYNLSENKIIWNGEVPAESSVILTFNVTLNENLPNGAIISNQGIVNWDSNGSGANDAIELTDDPLVDDGIDQDGDGNTLDDDPTILIVLAYEPPSDLTEDFSDDIPRGNATQVYFNRKWFETSEEIFGNIFEVSDKYKYSTDKAFKTKIRSANSSHYWNYSLSKVDSGVMSWEIWFRCANTSEDADLFLYFKNADGNDIITIKFEYIKGPADDPNEWILKLYFKNPSCQWIQLVSDYPDGYLYNDWYKLKIEKSGANDMIYSLDRTGVGLVDSKTKYNSPSRSITDLAYIEWKTTIDSIVCPMFFWDDHYIETLIID